MKRVELGTLLQVTQALEAVVGPCFGPSGGQVLFTRDSGEVLITRDGRRILTSLQLDHPIARVLVGCVSTHCKITGDGAKSFLLLLGELLRGIQGDHLHGTQARRMAHILHSFPTLVLDAVIEQGLAPHALSLLQDPAHLHPLMDAYFQGKTASSHWGVLSQTACEFYRRWRCDLDCTGLTLITRHFAALHTAVPGLALSRSWVLEGLVIHRDFTVHCSGEEPLRALATSMPLQSPLAPPGVALNLMSTTQVQRCFHRMGKMAEWSVACLQRLRVGLLLSAVKQSELVLDLARRAGLSMVECVDGDELALFCQLAGVELFADPGDWSLIGEEHVATVTFCKPVILGPHRFVHVGFQKEQGLAPHSLVLCGPNAGLAEQYSTAFCGLFQMLQHVFEPVLSRHKQSPVQSCHLQGGEEDSENLVKKPTLQNDTSIRCNEHLSTDSTEAGGPDSLLWNPNRGEGPQSLNREPNRGEGPLCAGQSQNPDSTESKAKAEHTVSDRLQNGKASGEGPGIHFGEGKAGALGSCSWETSGILIEAGSVLPAGGAFEIILHHCLQQQASKQRCPDLREACRLVAGAVLSVPRRLYAKSHFMDAQSHFLRASRATPSSWGVKGLESLACKYQLLLSVLHTAASLLSVDLILHTHMRCQKQHRQVDEEEAEE